ncbi:MAG: hypothetical protein J6U49_02055 [Alistipes sp.]|nr:hypothetical protein [Alistipes sp.]
MDWSALLIAIVGAALGGGGVGSLLYVRENRAQKALANELSLAMGWKEMAERKTEMVAEKDKKIEQLYDERAEQAKIIDDLRSDNARLSVFKCIKIGCADRKPPFGTTNTIFDYGNIKGTSEQ